MPRNLKTGIEVDLTDGWTIARFESWRCWISECDLELNMPFYIHILLLAHSFTMRVRARIGSSARVHQSILTTCVMLMLQSECKNRTYPASFAIDRATVGRIGSSSFQLLLRFLMKRFVGMKPLYMTFKSVGLSRDRSSPQSRG
jgi:hypothetical protein